ncbi:hypothetical protein ACOSQ3_029216 [Xanthoceras sorbifolium]
MAYSTSLFLEHPSILLLRPPLGFPLAQDGLSLSYALVEILLATSLHILAIIQILVDYFLEISGETCLHGCHRGKHLLSEHKTASSLEGEGLLVLDNFLPDRPAAAIGTGEQLSDRRQPAVDNAVAASRGPATHQVSIASDEEIQKLVSMGFEKVEVALAAADGDLNVAVEILMSQLG